MAAESDNSLDILLVVEPGLDGVFRHVEGLVSFLLSQHQTVHLAYSSRRSGQGMRALVERVHSSGGTVVDLQVSNAPQFGDVRALFRLVALIHRLRPDIVHAHSSKAGALLRIAAFITGHNRCFYTPHAYYGMAKPASLRVWFYNLIERRAAKIGTTIAISQDEASFAESTLRIPDERLHVIHNPVDTSRFQPPSNEQRRLAREKLGISPNAVVVATIGRMCWQKDPETAYKAVAPLCRDRSDLLFCHLGWGTWKNYLLSFADKLGIASNMRIFDYVEDPQEFYHAADLILVTSRYEAGWPLVLLEALACDLPIVAARCLGMSDLDRAGLSHVWTFPAEDVGSCTQALRAALETQRSGSLPSNHRTFALERLSPERCYGAVLALYHGHYSSVTPLDAPPATSTSMPELP